MEASDDVGFEIDEAEVIYWGRCPDCRASDATEPTANHSRPRGTHEQR